MQEHGSFFGLIPDTIFGRFKGILAYIRTWFCALWLIFFSANTFEVVVVDQVSIVLPLLKLFGFKTIFYCHYPDKLLSGKRGLLKKIYRLGLDLTEELSLFFTDKIYVNSLFTKETFYQSFSMLRNRKVEVEILYPSIDLSKFD